MSKVRAKEIVVGMSGGVDSSMALVLLRKAGWSPVGLSLNYAVWQGQENLLGGQDSNQHQFSGANSGNLQGARSEAMPQRIVSDEQRRRLPEFARPKGSQKMDDFCVAPPQGSVKLPFRRRALKSSHFLASKADAGSRPAPLRENICCSIESFKIAKSVCKKLDAPHYIYDVSKEFKEQVINYFIAELKNNRTPNPCIICNRYLKFKKLFEWAGKHNIKYVATGHYARIRKNTSTAREQLLKGKDKKKDQSYNLCLLPQRWLKHIIFPLGNYSKKEAFKMAEDQGFNFYLKRKQSQDFCFVASKADAGSSPASLLNCFLEKEIGQKPGLIKDSKGKTLGEHPGLHFYTIGQRKGINLSGGPYFVADKDIENNFLIVARNEKQLYNKEALLSPYYFISNEKLKKPLKVKAKIRSQHTPAKATLRAVDSKQIKIIFDKPQKAITPGQFAVFYQGDVCLGGGRIIRT